MKHSRVSDVETMAAKLSEPLNASQIERMHAIARVTGPREWKSQGERLKGLYRLLCMATDEGKA